MVVDGGPQEVCDGTPPGSIPHSSTISFASLKSERSFFVFLKSFFLVLTTGKFFNKVNQAESMDLSLALADPLGCVGGERNP